MTMEKPMGSTLIFSPVTASHMPPDAKNMGIPWIPIFVEIGSPGENP
jgi:hypothetical protein